MAVAPLVPTAVRVTLRPLLIPAAYVAGLFVAYGLIWCVSALVRALFGTAEGIAAIIPWLGRKVAGGVQKIEQRLTNYLGGLLAATEDKMGDALHSLATGVEHLAQELELAAVTTAQLGWLVTSKYSLAAMYYRLARLGLKQAHDLVTSKTVVRTVRVIEKEIAYPAAGRIGRLVKATVRQVAVELGNFEHWAIPRINAAGRAIARDIPGDIAGLRSRTKSLERGYTRLWRWVRQHQGALTMTAAGGLAVAFIGRLGGGWIFCRNWKRLGRGVCRMPASSISWILGLVSLVVVALNPEDVLHEAEDFTDELGALIRTMAGAPRE